MVLGSACNLSVISFFLTPSAGMSKVFDLGKTRCGVDLPRGQLRSWILSPSLRNIGDTRLAYEPMSRLVFSDSSYFSYRALVSSMLERNERPEVHHSSYRDKVRHILDGSIWFLKANQRGVEGPRGGKCEVSRSGIRQSWRVSNLSQLHPTSRSTQMERVPDQVGIKVKGEDK